MKIFQNFFCIIKYKYIFLSSVIVFCFLCLNLFNNQFLDHLAQGIKYTLQSTKPTEELFDDTGEVKLVSVLFGEESCVVSTMPLDYDLKLSQYSNIENFNGIIFVKEASGILYAPTFGKIKIKNLENGLNELTIHHFGNFSSIFTGNFNLGVFDGQIVDKNYPLALLTGDIEFYLELDGEIIDVYEFNGESLWQN